jgi:hypothetical protein
MAPKIVFHGAYVCLNVKRTVLALIFLAFVIES